MHARDVGNVNVASAALGIAAMYPYYGQQQVPAGKTMTLSKASLSESADAGFHKSNFHVMPPVLSECSDLLELLFLWSRHATKRNLVMRVLMQPCRA